MNIHKPGIRGLVLISGILALSLEGKSQVFRDRISDAPVASTAGAASPIVDYPVTDAYTAQPLVFDSASKDPNYLHREDRMLLAANLPERSLESLESRYRIPGTQNDDISKLTESIRRQIKEDPSRFSVILEIEIAANPGKICEIVKAAVEADERKAASVVEIVAYTAPEFLRLAAQCVIAVNPSSLQEVQSCLAKVDPGAGDGSSSKTGPSAKAKEALAAEKADNSLFSNRFGNPLDIPDIVIIKPHYDPSPANIPEASQTDSSIPD